MRYLLLLLLLIPITVLAQDEDAIILIPGETLAISVTGDMRTSANVTIDEATYVSVQVRGETGTLDPVVWIVDSNKRLIAYNDNGAEAGNALINNLYLLPDSYRVYVDSFNGVSDEEVTLSLNIVDPFDTAIEMTDNLVTINATLPEDSIFEYDFSASAGDVMTLIARDTSGTLDTYLSIYDESANLIVSNDDHQSTDLSLNLFDSKISEWIAPADGVYTLRVHDFAGKPGQFELIIISLS